MEFEVNQDKIDRRIKEIISYLVFLNFFGLIASLYNNYFTVGNGFVNNIVVILPILIFILIGLLMLMLLVRAATYWNGKKKY